MHIFNLTLTFDSESFDSHVDFSVFRIMYRKTRNKSFFCLILQKLYFKSGCDDKVSNSAKNAERPMHSENVTFRCSLWYQSIRMIDFTEDRF